MNAAFPVLAAIRLYQRRTRATRTSSVRRNILDDLIVSSTTPSSARIQNDRSNRITTSGHRNASAFRFPGMTALLGANLLAV